MQTNFRENYFEARDIVAQELKGKYNLVESYRDDSRLTLDSSSHSIHLTFYVPDGDNVSISEIGLAPAFGRTFRDFLFEKYPVGSDQTEAVKKIFKGSSRKPYSFELGEMLFTFQAKLNFLQELYPEKFG